MDVTALVDTGCEQSVICEEVCRRVGLKARGPGRVVQMLNGEFGKCHGEVLAEMKVNGCTIQSRFLVASELVLGAGMIIGVDLIGRLGGVLITPSLEVRFGRSVSFAAVGKVRETADDGKGKRNDGKRERDERKKGKRLEVLESKGDDGKKNDKGQPLSVSSQDFCAGFDGQRWTVEWRWKNGEPVIRNKCPGYPVAADVKEDFELEVEQWIKDGWLKEYDPVIHGRQEGVIPLLAVKQPNKQRRVRPVMDYRELNYHVISRPGTDAAVCQEKLRVWRKKSANAFVLDLRKAYLQIHVAESLQRFQSVRYDGKCYVMTRMGFGLNIAPKVMSKIISHVLSLNDEIARGTDHYIDDIYVDANVVDVSKVQRHLFRYGLVSKEPVSIDDARVLGLRVTAGNGAAHRWARDGALPRLSETVTKRELFSVFGKLIGHYPVAGWLRTACSYIKRLTSEIAWDDKVKLCHVGLARELMRRLQDDDPVQGVWQVPSNGKVTVWCDASNMAVACCLAVNGAVIEDAAWIRKRDDGTHINVAELDAVVKGLSLAVRWDMKDLEVITDSASVYNWVKSILEDSRRPKVSGLSEMIIRRRLGIISEMIEEYALRIEIRLVPSALNVADGLTRVPLKWVHPISKTRSPDVRVAKSP